MDKPIPDVTQPASSHPHPRPHPPISQPAIRLMAATMLMGLDIPDHHLEEATTDLATHIRVAIRKVQGRSERGGWYADPPSDLAEVAKAVATDLDYGQDYGFNPDTDKADLFACISSRKQTEPRTD